MMGIGFGLMLDELAAIHADFRLPRFALGGVSWHELVVGTLFLALPQVPLTLGNAIITITEENNNLFQNRPASERKVALSTGVMNLLAPLVGGVPMCHGAGGMAGHVRIGDRPRVVQAAAGKQIKRTRLCMSTSEVVPGIELELARTLLLAEVGRAVTPEQEQPQA